MRTYHGRWQKKGYFSSVYSALKQCGFKKTMQQATSRESIVTSMLITHVRSYLVTTGIRGGRPDNMNLQIHMTRADQMQGLTTACFQADDGNCAKSLTA